MSKAFGAKVRSLRKEMHMTQEELAARIGISRSTIAMYEQGFREPDFQVLDAIADLFDVSLNYLVSDGERGSYPRHEEDTGAVRMPRTMGVTLEEERLLKAYRAGSEELRKAVQAVLRIRT